MHLRIPQSNLPRIVFVGGGFGGLRLARQLARGNFQVVLIDKNNYHAFPPLLYQVATAGLDASAIATRRLWQPGARAVDMGTKLSELR
ncbi:MAG: FAD-dependent oxidoreductase [Cyclobacteriaceae bacterium]|nr:FAD-dependent oxidoreductase [Cyclobacteriaceae bacterium]